MPDEFDYKERVESMSPSTAGFSADGGGRAVMIQDVTYNDLGKKIREILGYTKKDGAGLARKLPKAHPLFPWLFASRISQVQGFGTMTQVASDPVEALEVAPFDDFARYANYRLTIEFEPRPYVLCRDDLISNTLSKSWTPPDGTPVGPLTYAEEWKRFVDIEFQGASQYLTAKKGQMRFNVAGGHELDGKEAGEGQIRMAYPKSTVIYKWYQVPYEHVIHVNSYIVAGLGCVNQFAWDDWPAGTLLFKDFKTRRYTPAAPEVNYDYGTVIWTNDKLCDIDFIFEYIEPTRTAAAASLANANAIDYGHNLVPYSNTGSWYYATTNIEPLTSVANDNKPIYPSYMFELLFTTPIP